MFLNHSVKDKATVRAVAERLRADGLKVKVWFDEWALPVAASRQSAESSLGGQGTREEDNGALPRRRYAEKIEERLEHSTFGLRISEFGLAKPGMSANAFGSDRGWPQHSCF